MPWAQSRQTKVQRFDLFYNNYLPIIILLDDDNDYDDGKPKQ